MTPALRDYAEKRVAKLEKYFQWRDDVQVEVALSVERETHIAEITYQLGGFLMRRRESFQGSVRFDRRRLRQDRAAGAQVQE